VDQSGQRKAVDGQPKLYAWHAPEVDCINKGKAKTPYEFGVKVGIASTLKGNLIVGAKAFHGNPYDGHTLNEQLEQATILMQDTGQAHDGVCGPGLSGVDAQPRCAHRAPGQEQTHQRAGEKAAQAAPGHRADHRPPQADHRMDRCHLKGETGDRLHAVLCAAGYNIRWLLRMIAKKGITFLSQLFLRLSKIPSNGRTTGIKPAALGLK
jgi:transposase, IS5 family